MFLKKQYCYDIKIDGEVNGHTGSLPTGQQHFILTTPPDQGSEKVGYGTERPSITCQLWDYCHHPTMEEWYRFSWFLTLPTVLAMLARL